MTATPTLEPERVHELLVNAVDGLAPPSPPIDAMRWRAELRRYGWIAAGMAGLAVAAVTAAVVTLGGPAGRSTQQTLSVSPPPPVQPPASTDSGPSRQQLRHGRQLCRRYAAHHTFLRADSAVVNGSTVSIVGHQGGEHCGGPDDVSYVQSKAVATFTLAPGAKIGAAVIGGQRDRSISTTALPGYLQHTEFGFFRYTGPPTAITRLIELYHP